MEKQNELLINEAKSNNLAVKSNKQIEEMATIICLNTEFDTMWDECYQSANALYNVGYRKADEIAREIFEEVERAFGGAHMLWYHTRPGEFEEYEKIKKKYIGEDINVPTNTEGGK